MGTAVLGRLLSGFSGLEVLVAVVWEASSFGREIPGAPSNLYAGPIHARDTGFRMWQRSGAVLSRDLSPETWGGQRQLADETPFSGTGSLLRELAGVRVLALCCQLAEKSDCSFPIEWVLIAQQTH